MRQEFLLLPLLFIISLKILVKVVRRRKKKWELERKKHGYCLQTVGLSSTSKRSYKQANHNLKDFSKVSGTKVNIQESCFFWEQIQLNFFPDNHPTILTLLNNSSFPYLLKCHLCLYSQYSYKYINKWLIFTHIFTSCSVLSSFLQIWASIWDRIPPAWRTFILLIFLIVWIWWGQIHLTSENVYFCSLLKNIVLKYIILNW